MLFPVGPAARAPRLDLELDGLRRRPPWVLWTGYVGHGRDLAGATPAAGARARACRCSGSTPTGCSRVRTCAATGSTGRTAG